MEESQCGPSPIAFVRHAKAPGSTKLHSVAGLWWWLSAPTPTAVRTAEVSCRMGGRSGCSVPERDTVGPIIVAVTGAFLILIGTILYAGGQPTVKDPSS